MSYIELEEIELIGEHDAGRTYTFETLARSGFIFAERKAGSVSGNHYHEGKSDAKNPEILLLTQGEAHLEGKLHSGEEVFNQRISAPILVKIYPNVIHTLTALTAIQFLEFNSLEEHKADTKYHKQNES